MPNYKLIERFLKDNGYNRTRVDSPYGGDIQYIHPDGRQVACSYTEKSGDSPMYGYHPSWYVNFNGTWSWCSIRGYMKTETQVVEHLMHSGVGC